MSDLLFRKEYILVAFMFAILLIIIVPLNTLLLDFFLVLSLSSAVLILLLSLFVKNPTDLSTFPTLLLVLVLFRLALNIATTRSILSDGHLGVEAVSSIIASFGKFVVGGNMVIGVIIFIILVLINFIVITKGAGRVAEVRARFALDALPGKQMAIDVDLNAGIITQEEASQRRAQLNDELSFYGTMDGSAKFVKGDAIAGILITIVNIIGGLLIGIFQYDMSAQESTEVFTILTIGDGLVSQIPSLIISTATAIIITRSNSADEDNFARGTIGEMSKDSRALIITGFSLIMFAFVPGFPVGILLTMGMLLMVIGYTVYSIQTNQDNFLSRTFAEPNDEDVDKTTMSPDEIRELKRKQNQQNEQANLDQALSLKVCELRLGALLLPLISTKTNELQDKIKNLRVKIAKELGFVIPKIQITDDNTLDPNEYAFYIKKVPVIKTKIEPNKFLVMGDISKKPIKGTPTKDPVFNMDALWIETNQKNEALGKGHSVIDNASVISAHIAELIKQYAHDILTRDDIVNNLQKLKNEFPALISDIEQVSDKGIVFKVCKALLREKVPIVDMLSIIEIVLESFGAPNAPATPDSKIIEHVRAKLSRLITKTFLDSDGRLHLFTISPQLEYDMLNSIDANESLRLTADILDKLIQEIQEEVQKLRSEGIMSLSIATKTAIREPLYRLLEATNKVKINVLAEAEIDMRAELVVHKVLGNEINTPNNEQQNT